jgi:hypothetical protein
LDYRRDSIDTFLEHFGAPEVVVSTRYHGALVAAWHGSRVAVIARSTKLRAIAEDLDLPWTDAIASAHDLRVLIERSRVVRRDRLERQRARAIAMCTAFMDWLEDGTREQIATAAVGDGAGAEPETCVPLRRAEMRATIEIDLPAMMHSGTETVVQCAIHNRSSAVYVTAPPNPVSICYRWYDAQAMPVGAGTWIHTALPHALRPGETVDAAARIAPPTGVGTYTLAITLLQHEVAWFDDVDSDSGVRVRVTVEDAAPP